jgi:hypothetical protein
MHDAVIVAADPEFQISKKQETLDQADAWFAFNHFCGSMKSSPMKNRLIVRGCEKGRAIVVGDVAVTQSNAEYAQVEEGTVSVRVVSTPAKFKGGLVYGLKLAVVIGPEVSHQSLVHTSGELGEVFLIAHVFREAPLNSWCAWACAVVRGPHRGTFSYLTVVGVILLGRGVGASDGSFQSLETRLQVVGVAGGEPPPPRVCVLDDALQPRLGTMIAFCATVANVALRVELDGAHPGQLVDRSERTLIRRFLQFAHATDARILVFADRRSGLVMSRGHRLDILR